MYTDYFYSLPKDVQENFLREQETEKRLMDFFGGSLSEYERQIFTCAGIKIQDMGLTYSGVEVLLLCLIPMGMKVPYEILPIELGKKLFVDEEYNIIYRCFVEARLEMENNEDHYIRTWV